MKTFIKSKLKMRKEAAREALEAARNAIEDWFDSQEPPSKLLSSIDDINKHIEEL
jgi:hypothetical protein